MRCDHGGNGKSGSSFRVQLAGVHKAALNDNDKQKKTTAGPVWTSGSIVRCTRWILSVSSIQLLFLGYLEVCLPMTFPKRANGAYRILQYYVTFVASM